MIRLGLGIGLGLGNCPLSGGNASPTPSGTYTTEDGAQNYTDESGNPYQTENS
ncbi:MAG: hypothetical protein U0835_00200 [Isosphaeraceae bacterium]